MDVILKQDVKNLGYADDIVKVRNGYGRNFLIPRGLAVIANETNRKVHQEIIRQRAHKASKMKMDAEKLQAALEGLTLNIAAKTGESGKLFGSVTTQQLVDKLKSIGYEIDKKNIHLPLDHIKQLGTYQADVTIHRDVKAKLTFEVIEE